MSVMTLALIGWGLIVVILLDQIRYWCRKCFKELKKSNDMEMSIRSECAPEPQGRPVMNPKP